MTPLKHLALIGLFLVPTGWQDPAAAERGRADLERLAWIAGTWVLEDGEHTTEEHWRPLQGTTLIGTSHTYDGERSHFFEFLRITAMHGQIAYVASPGGAPPTAFLLARLEDGLVEFENAQHDHPQRVRYERTEAGLTATISQLDGSRAQSFAFSRR